jgi:2,3-dihydroxybenzoate decarboxylase
MIAQRRCSGNADEQKAERSMTAGKRSTATPRVLPAAGYKRIATEEAFAPADMLQRYRRLLESGSGDPGFDSLWGFYLGSTSPRATQVAERLQDLGERRLDDMHDTGIDRQILALTSPGVQIFDTATARSIAVAANDELADAVRRHPDKYTGLAAVAPQDPAAAAKEIQRGVQQLGMRGVIVNSHTHDEYLDQPKFWEIFAAAEALGVPLYLHPNTPSRGLIKPLLEAGLDGAVFGFGVETGMHLLRIIVAGVFDRFPKLQIIVGHAGEALPFWLFRLDYMHDATVQASRYAHMKPLQKKISDYMRENVYVTSSGMPWNPAITFCQNVLGADRVLYAMDYPYQFVAEEVIASDRMTMSDADKKKFFQTNAERVFGL